MYSLIGIINGIFLPVHRIPHGSICLSNGIKTQQKEKGATLLLCAYNCSATFFFSQKENADRPAISSETMNTFFVNHKWFFSQRAGSHMF